MDVIKKSSIFAAVFLGAFAGSARAQGIITVKVPFPFAVGRQAFPAGHYDIHTADYNGTVIAIRGTDNSAASFALTTSADGGDPIGEQPALVFLKSETGYRLSQIWESSTEGLALMRFQAGSRVARAETQIGLPEDSTYLVEASWK